MGLTSANMTLVAVGMNAKEFSQWVVSSESGSFWRMSWAIRETEASVEMVGRASWKNFLQLLITINYTVSRDEHVREVSYHHVKTFEKVII